MPTLSNGVYYANPFFAPAFAEYLISNGFFVSERKGQICFYNEKIKVIVANDSVFCYGYHPEEPGQENEKWVFEQSHTGISHFNIHNWIMLMDLMKIVMVGDFLHNAKMGGRQLETEASFIINSLHKQQLQKVS
jgi:hypothetical protein